ncbi:MAG: TraB/GumN family protein [Cyclobacteriaceae bacterium]|nr:TraB/GumN family protein [Cyclobacteriaceae bacterium]
MKMILRNSGLLLLVAIIFVSGGVHAQKKNSEKSLLWKISGNGLKQPSYLFGTYHLLGDKFLSQVPEVQQPFAEQRVLWLNLCLIHPG